MCSSKIKTSTSKMVKVTFMKERLAPKVWDASL